MVISTPGTYVVPGFLECTGDGVDITTSDVTVEFAGGDLYCPCLSGTQAGIRVYDPAGGTISNVNILGSGVIDSYPIGVSFSGVKTSQLSGIHFQFGGSNIVLNDDSNGDHSQHDLFTDNTFYSASAGNIVGNSIYDSTFIGNNCGGTIDGGIGVGIQILNGNGNVITGNTSGGFLAGIELGGAGSTGAANNSFVGNYVTGNTTGVLVTPPANHNQFVANYIDGDTSLDIDEGNSSCGTDVWTKDIFSTANQSCVH